MIQYDSTYEEWKAFYVEQDICDDPLDYTEWLCEQKQILEEHDVEFVHSVDDETLLQTWHKSEVPNGVLVEITTPEGGIDYATPYYRTDKIIPSISWWLEQGFDIDDDYQKSDEYDYSGLDSETLLSRII